MAKSKNDPFLLMTCQLNISNDLLLLTLVFTGSNCLFSVGFLDGVYWNIYKPSSRSCLINMDFKSREIWTYILGCKSKGRPNWRSSTSSRISINLNGEICCATNSNLKESIFSFKLFFSAAQMSLQKELLIYLLHTKPYKLQINFN